MLRMIVTEHEPAHNAKGEWPRRVSGVLNGHKVEVGPTYHLLTETEYEALQQRPQGAQDLIERGREAEANYRRVGKSVTADLLRDLLAAVEADACKLCGQGVAATTAPTGAGRRR